MARIIAFGCSFTQGVGVSEQTPHTSTVPDPGAWPAQLGRELGVFVENKGTGGNSIKDVVYKVVHYDFMPGDIVCVQWPHFSRHTIIGGRHLIDPEMGPADDRFHAGLAAGYMRNPDGSDREKAELIENYFMKYYTDTDALFNSLIHMNFVKLYLDSIDVPLYNISLDNPESEPVNRWPKKWQIEWHDQLDDHQYPSIKHGPLGHHLAVEYHISLAKRLAQRIRNDILCNN